MEIPPLIPQKSHLLQGYQSPLIALSRLAQYQPLRSLAAERLGAEYYVSLSCAKYNTAFASTL
jgi:hypothetical protein